MNESLLNFLCLECRRHGDLGLEIFHNYSNVGRSSSVLLWMDSMLLSLNSLVAFLELEKKDNVRKKLTSHSLRSRRLEVVGERENGRARGRHARGVSFSRARFFLCPLLLSACHAG